MLSSVMIDSREPDWVKEASFGVPAAVSTLDAGDVWLATDDALIIIERKTPNDLLNTIREDRLFAQCARMKELSPWSYLVITGSILRGPDGKVWLDNRTTGWDFNAVQGALLTVQELGIGIVYCGEMDFVQTAIRLANRDRTTLRVGAARLAVSLRPDEEILASLPGIGWDKAKALLEHCGSAAWALDHLTRTGEDHIPGIGDGIKRQVRRALGLANEFEIQVVCKEQNGNGKH